MAKKAIKFDVSTHMLVPKHSKTSQKEVKEVYEKYNISFEGLPKISVDDPAIKALKLKHGDVVKIERASATDTDTVYYRGVVSE